MKRTSNTKTSFKNWNSYRQENILIVLVKIMKKNYGAPMKPSELFCFKDTKNFAALLAVCYKKFQQVNATDMA